VLPGPRGPAGGDPLPAACASGSELIVIARPAALRGNAMRPQTGSSFQGQPHPAGCVD